MMSLDVIGRWNGVNEGRRRDIRQTNARRLFIACSLCRGDDGVLTPIGHGDERALLVFLNFALNAWK
jgi:hypothetical protein